MKQLNIRDDSSNLCTKVFFKECQFKELNFFVNDFHHHSLKHSFSWRYFLNLTFILLVFIFNLNNNQLWFFIVMYFYKKKLTKKPKIWNSMCSVCNSKIITCTVIEVNKIIKVKVIRFPLKNVCLLKWCINPVKVCCYHTRIQYFRCVASLKVTLSLAHSLTHSLSHSLM